MNDIGKLTLAAMAGLLTIQVCGLLNLGLGAVLNRWKEPLIELVFSYSIGPLAAQLALCCAAGLIARVTRRVLWVE
jgi:biotin transport system substrate-specific component